MPDYNFDTGPSTLPDIGVLSYNGCTFSPLFTSEVKGRCIKDKALRTTKYMEYDISVDGYVTLPESSTSISPTMDTLRRLLTAQAGVLVYRGRGCDIIVNTTPNNRDVSWGPSPELLEFQPLGGGLSAKVRWQVKVRIPETKQKSTSINSLTGVSLAGIAIPLLEFTYDCNISYGEDYYSTISCSGTLEVPLTRNPNQGTRTVPYTADDFRNIIEQRLITDLDLSRFTIVKRDFNISRDKRTLEWSFQAEEKSYMDLPPNCTIAKGGFSVRPAKAGLGLALWLCTLRATYTVRKDAPRRTAWLAFLALLRLRMQQVSNASIPDIDNPRSSTRLIIEASIRSTLTSAGIPTGTIPSVFVDEAVAREKERLKAGAWLMDFSVDEGLYLDSKTVSFSASWRLTTHFSHILLASGVWVKLNEVDASGNNKWVTSIRDISGSRSWLTNRVNNRLDVIVDFGS